jgi:hypothetical protein
MKLRALFLVSASPLLAIDNAIGQLDTDDAFDAVCDVCKSSAMQLSSTDAECDGGVAADDLLAKPGCFSLAPLGVQLAELRAAVRELQRVCGVFQKDISYCKKQGALISGLDPKIHANRKGLAGLKVDLESLDEQVVALRSQTGQTTSELTDQLKNIESDVFQKIEVEKQAIRSDMSQTLKDSLQTQSSDVTAQFANISNMFKNLQCILGANANFQPLDSNYINKIFKEIESLKEKTSSVEKNIGEVNNLSFKMELQKLEPNYISSSNIMEFLNDIVEELITIKNTFDEKAQTAMQQTIFNLNAELKEDISEISTQLVVINEGLQGLVGVLGGVTSADIEKLTNLANIETIVSQNVDKYVGSITFANNVTFICQGIIRILIEQIVPELINSTISELLGDTLPTMNDMADFREDIQKSIQTGISTELSTSGIQQALDTLQDISSFPDLGALLDTVENHKTAVANLEKDVGSLKGVQLDVTTLQGQVTDILEKKIPPLDNLLSLVTGETALTDLKKNIDDISDTLDTFPDLPNLVTTQQNLQGEVTGILAAVDGLVGLKTLVSTQNSHSTALTDVQNDVNNMLATVNGLDGFKNFVSTQGTQDTTLTGVRKDVDDMLAAVNGLNGLKDFVNAQSENSTAITNVQKDVGEILTAVNGVTGLKTLVGTQTTQDTTINNVRKDVDEIQDYIKKLPNFTTLLQTIDDQDALIDEQVKTIKDMNDEIDQLEGKILALTSQVQTVETGLATLITNIAKLLEVGEPALKSTSTRG